MTDSVATALTPTPELALTCFSQVASTVSHGAGGVFCLRHWLHGL